MMLNLAVSPYSVPSRAPLLENLPHLRHPDPGSRGVHEPADRSAPTRDVRDTDARTITALDVDSITSARRGVYQVNFTYTLGDPTGRTPIRFHCIFEGDALDHVSYGPWEHTSADRDCTVHGFCTLTIDTPDAPISLGTARFRLEAQDKDDRAMMSVRITPKFAWYKTYDQVSLDNLQAYFADRASPTSMASVKTNEGDDSLRQSRTSGVERQARGGSTSYDG